MANALSNTAPQAVRDHAAPPEIRHIGVADLREALRRGIADFLAAPTQIAFLCIIYPLVGLAAARLAVNETLMPLVYPLIAGLSLLGPLTALGLYEISRRREAGLPASWRDAFAIRHAPGLGGIIVLGVILLGLFLAWIAAARAVFTHAFGPVAMTPGAFLSALTSPEGVTMIILGHAVGLVFAAIALALTVVSFPMLLDRNVGVGTAIGTSVRAVMANPVAMAAWGLIVVVALALGSLPLFVGLAVVMPVLGHATWHLYRRVVVPATS